MLIACVAGQQRVNTHGGDRSPQGHNSHAYLLAAYDVTMTKVAAFSVLQEKAVQVIPMISCSQEREVVKTFDFISVSLFEPNSLAKQAIIVFSLPAGQTS